MSDIVIPAEIVNLAHNAWHDAWWNGGATDSAMTPEECIHAALVAAVPAIRLAVLREEISLGDQWQVEDPRMRYVDVQVGKETYLEVHGRRS